MPAGMRTTCVAVAALLLILVGGCGGGGADTTSTTGGQELTRSELIAKGDAICEDAHERFAQLQASPPTTPEESATLTQQLIDITETEVASCAPWTPRPR